MLPQKGVTMLSTEKTWWAQHLKFVKKPSLVSGIVTQHSRSRSGKALPDGPRNVCEKRLTNMEPFVEAMCNRRISVF